MAQVLTLQQLSVVSVLRVLFSRSDVTLDGFIMQLPLPTQIRDSIAQCCAGEVMQAVLSRILACNVYLSPEQNSSQPLPHHSWSNMSSPDMQLYRSSLIKIFIELLEDSILS